MKVLVLVISSDNEPIYDKHKEIWRSYMHRHPEFESYFLQYRDGPQELDGDIFWLNGKESLKAILKKTLDSFEFFLQRGTYDFIVRTNLSSVWNFKALHKYLETLPRSRLYNGYMGNYDGKEYVSGAGIILTPDVASLLIEHRKLVESYNIIDDVDIGYALTELNVQPTNASRKALNSMHLFRNYTFEKDIYHYRCKLDRRSPTDKTQEIFIMKKIVQAISAED